MDRYIKEAKDYYKVAVDELTEGKNNGNIKLAVDGCEEGWLALNLAVKSMFIRKGVKEEGLPNTFRGIRFFLIKYWLRRIFAEARDVLHIDGFYDRDVVFESGRSDG